MNTHKKGFTLIELLVVVAIIGLLSSIVLSSLNTARVKARNAQRNTEIEQLRNAFSIVYTSTGVLPTSGGFYCLSASCYGSWTSGNVASAPAVDAYFIPYMAKPVDPPGGRSGSGGFEYFDTSVFINGATSPVTGEVFSAGYYFEWLLEDLGGSVPAGMCGPGRIHVQEGGYVTCLLRLDKW